MKRELTPWFPAHIKPARRGWYLREYANQRAYSHWDGMRWSMGCYSLVNANFVKDMNSVVQELRWRGLARKPK